MCLQVILRPAPGKEGASPRAGKRIGLKNLVGAITENRVENNIAYQVGRGK